MLLFTTAIIIKDPRYVKIFFSFAFYIVID